MRTVNFYQVNTFTDEPFSGESVAVISQAIGLYDQDMLDISAELNLAGTVFILPSNELAKSFNRLRHFQRINEVAYDEKTTLASVWVMATEKCFPVPMNGSLFYRVEQPPTDTIPIEIRSESSSIQKVMLASAMPILEKPLKQIVKALQNALGLSQSQIDKDFGVVATHNYECVLVPLKDKRLLQEIGPNQEQLTKIFNDYKIQYVSLTFAPSDNNNHLWQRCFSTQPEYFPDGIHCHSASAAALKLFQQRSASCQDGKYEIKIEQSTAPEKRGLIYCEMNVKKAKATTLRIGGAAVIVMTGKLQLPS